MTGAPSQAVLTEPRGFTTADLIALVIGSSLALALPWHSSASDRIRFASGLMPSAFACLGVVDETIRKACLALTPVFFIRRVRSPGRTWAVEWLVVFCASTELIRVVESVPWIANSFYLRTFSRGGTKVVVTVPAWPLWHWKVGASATGLTASTLLLLRQKAFQGLTNAVLLVLASLGLRATVPDVIAWGSDRIGVMLWISEDLRFLIYEAFDRFPLYLLLGIPACAALAAVRQTPRPVRCWADCVGIGLAAILLLTDQTMQFWADAAGPPFVAPLIAIHGAQLLVGGVLNWSTVAYVRYCARERGEFR